MAFDEKIDKLTKAQPDISTLVEELFPLRRGTNTLLKAQSALYPTTKDEITAVEIVL